MEDTLRVGISDLGCSSSLVLILVLMEDTLRVKGVHIKAIKIGLNPCFNGRYSQRRRIDATGATARTSLNPCFNGRYSQSERRDLESWEKLVLILVLMEDTLRVLANLQKETSGCLNPCFNGRYSQSIIFFRSL